MLVSSSSANFKIKGRRWHGDRMLVFGWAVFISFFFTTITGRDRRLIRGTIPRGFPIPQKEAGQQVGRDTTRCCDKICMRMCMFAPWCIHTSRMPCSIWSIQSSSAKRLAIRLSKGALPPWHMSSGLVAPFRPVGRGFPVRAYTLAAPSP